MLKLSYFTFIRAEIIFRPPAEPWLLNIIPMPMPSITPPYKHNSNVSVVSIIPFKGAVKIKNKENESVPTNVRRVNRLLRHL